MQHLRGRQKSLLGKHGEVEEHKRRGKGFSSLSGIREFTGSDKGDVFLYFSLTNIQTVQKNEWVYNREFYLGKSKLEKKISYITKSQ